MLKTIPGPDVDTQLPDLAYEADPHEAERLHLTELARCIEDDTIAQENLGDLMWNYVGAPALDRRFSEGLPPMTRERMLRDGGLEQTRYTRELINHISPQGDVLYIRGIDHEQDANHPDSQQKYIVVTGNLFDENGLTEYRTGGARETTWKRGGELWLQLQRMKPGNLHEPKIMDTDAHMREWDGIRVRIDGEDVHAENLVSEHALFAEFARGALIHSIVNRLELRMKSRHATEEELEAIREELASIEEKHMAVLGDRAITTHGYETPTSTHTMYSRSRVKMEFYPLDHLSAIIQANVDRQHLTLAA